MESPDPGTPEIRAQQIAELRRVTGTDNVVTEFAFDGIPHDEAEKNKHLFAGRVLPVLRQDGAFAAPPAPGKSTNATADLFASA